MLAWYLVYFILSLAYCPEVVPFPSYAYLQYYNLAETQIGRGFLSHEASGCSGV